MGIVTKAKASRKARTFYDKGLEAMERGKLGIACDMFLSALKLEPGFLEARKFLWAAALRQYRDRKQRDHRTCTWSSLRGAPAILMARSKLNKKPLEALLTAERLLVKNPLNTSFAFLLCDAADKLHLPEISVQCLNILKDHRPYDVKVWYRLAEAYNSNHQLTDARDILQHLLKLHPNDQTLLKKYKDASALATMQEGGWGKAFPCRSVVPDQHQAVQPEQENKTVPTGSEAEARLTELQRKVAAEPANLNYRRALADHLVHMGRPAHAYTTLEEADRLAGGADPVIDRMLSEVRQRILDDEIAALRQRGEDARALAKVAERDEFLLTGARERVQRYPNEHEFKYEYGLQLYQRGMVDQAIQAFQAAQRSPKHRIRSLYYLGLCFKSKQLYDLADEQFRMAAAEMRDMTDVKKDILYELGQVAEAMGNADQARERYKRIYAVDIGYKDVAHKVERSTRPW